MILTFFFECPAIYSGEPGDYSRLKLLRRDIMVCLGIDPNSGQPINFRAPLLGTMAILVGIDLLGKFLAGNDGKGKVGERFQDFMSKYFCQVSRQDAAIIYQLRNSLLHSFGLHSRDGKGNVYEFGLSIDAGQGPLVQRCRQGQADHYLVDVGTLRVEFETAIGQYEKDLRDELSLQSCFKAMFPTYGRLYFKST